MRTQLRFLALLAALASAPAISFAQSATTAAGTAVPSGAATTSQNVQSTAGGQVRAGQPGQVQPGQVQPGQLQPAQARPGQGQAGQRQGGPGQGGMSVSAFLAHKLRQGNQAEVELGKLAAEKAKSDSVKEFAQMMVKHHTEMIQKIDQANIGQQGGGQPGAGAQGGGAQGRQSVRQLVTQTAPSAQIGSNVRNSQSNTDGQERAVTPPGGTSQGSSAAGQAGGATPAGTPAPGAATTANPGINPAAGQAGNVTPAQGTLQTGRQPGVVEGQPGVRGRGMGGRVPQQLIAIVDQAGDNELQMTKEMLQKKQGEDFDMCYIGQQIVAHTCMLAKLQAIKSSGPDDMDQLVTEAEKATREHLDRATKIAEDLKGKK